MVINYTPHGVCTREINIDVVDGIVKDVKFLGGCSGNTQGVGILVQGMKVEDVIHKLENIRCGNRKTSCPAELAKALRENMGK